MELYLKYYAIYTIQLYFNILSCLLLKPLNFIEIWLQYLYCGLRKIFIHLCTFTASHLCRIQHMSASFHGKREVVTGDYRIVNLISSYLIRFVPEYRWINAFYTNLFDQPHLPSCSPTQANSDRWSSCQKYKNILYSSLNRKLQISLQLLPIGKSNVHS